MYNIIKSLNYSARHDIVNILTIISMFGIPAFVMYIKGMIDVDSTQKLTPSIYFASETMAVVFVFLQFGIMILASRLVAGDAGDKTINYEFMSGHSRKEIFAGRITAGFLWGSVISFITVITPLFYLEAFYGWGPETSKENVILRCILLFFPIIRLTAFNIMLASVSRSAGKGIALGYTAMMVVAIVTSTIQEFTGKEISYPTGMTNAALLLTSKNSRNVVMDGNTVTLFDTAISGEMIYKTILFSLVFTIIYLVITYMDIKKKDRD